MRLSRFGYVIFAWLAVMLATVAVRAEENRGRNYFDLGIFAFEEGDFKAAERHFKMALGADPDHPRYNYYLGKTYLELEKLDAAQKYLEAAWIVDPEIAGLKFDRGMLFFKKKEYDISSTLFRQAATDDPDDVLANYYSGLSLFREENYGDAVIYFNKAEKQSVSIQDNARFYAGICYLKIGKVVQAKNNLNHLKEHAADPVMKEQAKKWLDAMARAKKVKKSYDLYAKLGIQYEDNVRLRSSEDVILADDQQENGADSAVVEGDDDDFSVVGFFSGRYDFINRDKFKIGAGYSHYQTMHFDLSNYDLMGVMPKVYFAYRRASMSFYLNYMPSFYWLDSEKFLNRHQVRPELSWELGDQYSARFTYNFYADDHQIEEDFTGNTHAFDARIYYKPVNKALSLYAGTGFDLKSADQDYLTYNQAKLEAGINYITGSRFELGAKLRYFNRSYDQEDPSYKKKRDENKIKLDLSVSRVLIKDWLRWMVAFKHVRDDSTIDELDYDSNTVALSVVARY